MERTAGELSRFPRVPPGRHGLPREFVAEHQRRRLMTATAELVAKRGYQGTALTRICSVAGVARNTFYEHFSDKEACFLATYDDAVEQARRRVVEAIHAEADWPDRMAAGLAAFLDFVVSEPALARLIVAEAPTAGPVGVRRYEETIRSLIPYFEAGREDGEDDTSHLMEETIVRGLVWMVYQRLALAASKEIPGLLPEIVEFAVAPYRGAEAARRAAEAVARN